eukprot:IDg9382t1
MGVSHKRRPDGTIIKYKARLCARGDRQIKGESFREVYAPVVTWPLVRMLFVLCLICKLRTRHIDFGNAFALSNFTEDIYLEMPLGFNSDSKENVLKLHKSLFGLWQAAHIWHTNIIARILRRVFKQSKLDPCLFFGSSIIVIIYVDDMLIFVKHDLDIESFITSLREEYPLTDEGDVRAYLGVSVDCMSDGSLYLRQQQSISKLLDLVHVSQVLHQHPHRSCLARLLHT